MIVYDNYKVGKRLQSLRKEKGWSLSDMAKKLDELIGRDNEHSEHKLLALNGEGGRQIVSRFESGERITYDIIFGYAEIFGVSADYVLCRIENEFRANAEICDIIGLNDKAIKALNNAPRNSHIVVLTNALLEQTLKSGFSVLDCIDEFFGANKKKYRLAEQLENDEFFTQTPDIEIVDGKDMRLIKGFKIIRALEQLKLTENKGGAK